MSKRSERLFEALSEINEGKIDWAAPTEETKKGQSHWKRWTALAAALALAIGVGSYVVPRIGGSAGGPGSNAGGEGADGASTFMSYAGPVLPLTLREADGSITAEREITLDFAPTWVPTGTTVDGAAADGYYRSVRDVRVTDAYTLTNTSQEDKTVSVLYPFVSSLRELDQHKPTLTADGQELEAALLAGQVAGSWQGGGEGGPFAPWEPEGMHLLYAGEWEDYRVMLEDRGYLETALADWPDFSGIPAIVYEFTVAWGPEADEQAGRPNPTLRNVFHLDYNKTTVLSYGFNGHAFDIEGGRMDKQFSIPQPGSRDEGMARYLIVVGEDIGPIETQGYNTGGWDTTQTVEGGVTIRRYETDLEDALDKVFRDMYNGWGSGGGLQDQGFALFSGLMKDQLLAFGTLSADPMERYRLAGLGDLDAPALNRVFYLEAQVTIPAGGSVQLTAAMTKDGSYDYHCTHTENQGVYGYDVATELGSNLTCTAQTAVLEDRGQIEIVRQNFGFDLENGINRVTLDPEAEHYYLEVRSRADQ